MSTIISILQDKISRKISELEQMKGDIEEKLEVVEGLTKEVQTMASNSGSSAQERRRVKTLDLNESIQQHRQQIDDIRAAVAECEEEIQGLERQKEDMEIKFG